MTSVGDIDGDEQLDIVVVRNNEYSDGGGIWVWNPRTKALIARSTAGETGGVAFIGNVAGDCKPEIGVTFSGPVKNDDVQWNHYTPGIVQPDDHRWLRVHRHIHV
jgi:hypothetical protein